MQDIRKDEEQYMQEGSEAFTRKVMVKYLSLKKKHNHNREIKERPLIPSPV